MRHTSLRPRCGFSAWICGILGGPSLVLAAVGLSLAWGCAAPNLELQGHHFTLSHPDFWQVKQLGKQDGEATILTIGRFGEAVIDDGTGTLEIKQGNYESVQADVDTRIYTWPAPPDVKEPTAKVAQLLASDPDLLLQQHKPIADLPPECDLLKKKYVIVGTKQPLLDLVKRPGWRVIVMGGVANGVLIGVVTRVDFEQDGNRYCHNLSNMQTQLQHVLEGLRISPPSPAPAAPAPETKP